MRFYNTKILPRLIHWVCSQKDFSRQREKIVPLASGRVLEVGMGSGLNLPFYDASNIDRVWGLEPDEALLELAGERAGKAAFDVSFIHRSGEEIPLENRSMDTVLVTYTLCTIPDVGKALGEMRRVLKPGGRLLFCEHGRAPDGKVAAWQDRITPAWKKVSGGCRLNRPIPALIREGGFKIDRLKEGYNGPIRITGFTYRGVAVCD